MKRINNIFKILFLCIIMVCSTNTVTGCKNNSKAGENKYYLYYVNKNHTKLVSVNHYTDRTDSAKLVDELLTAMNKTSSKINYVTAIPSNVSVTKWKIEDKVLYIDFDSAYLEMDKVKEILCRSAVVLTMSQISGVDYVSFTVKGEPLAENAGKAVGNMKASDFIDNSGSTINSYENMTAVIYYSNKKGDKLISKKVSAVYSANTSMEKFIIEQLQKGTKDDNTKRTLPSNVKLNGVSTKDGICYVNFDAGFLTEKIDVTNEVELYSIVNSLCELSYINKVQISINGDIGKSFHDKISLNDYFVRNLDIVESQDNE